MSQVAGSFLAAVAAALLASCFGVHGTILGAGVVSAVATRGGSLLQHVFSRTGEQLRDAVVLAGPGGAGTAPARRVHRGHGPPRAGKAGGARCRRRPWPSASR
ncbi:hypothetical protein GCM10020295_20630 [Streptomyces cinereospinus]